MNSQIGDYIIDKMLGQGNFGQVYLVHSKNNPEQFYALKVQMQTNVNEEMLLNQFKMYKFQNVVNVIEIFKFQQMQFSYDCILMDYCNCNDLYSLLFNYNRKHMLTFEQKKDLIFQIAYGIYEIHKEEIIHRDIKPQNIMLHQEKDKIITKICDFGLSKKYQKNNINTVNIGTPLYMAPEMLNQDDVNNDNYDKQIDVWAFGVLMYDFFNDQMLFIGKNIIEIQSKILTPINPNIAQCFNDQTLADVFLGCVVLQSEKRLKIEDVLNKLDKDRFQQLTGKENNQHSSIQNTKDKNIIKNKVILRGFIRDQNYVNKILYQIEKGINAEQVINSLYQKADELFQEF